jgi:hypothetical protein
MKKVSGFSVNTALAVFFYIIALLSACNKAPETLSRVYKKRF